MMLLRGDQRDVSTRAESAAVREATCRCEPAFDGIIKIDCTMPYKILEHSRSIAELFASSICGIYLEDVCVLEQKANLSRFIEDAVAAMTAGRIFVNNAHTVTFIDACQLRFDCELRIVGSILQNSVLLGIWICSRNHSNRDVDPPGDKMQTEMTTRATQMTCTCPPSMLSPLASTPVLNCNPAVWWHELSALSSLSGSSFTPQLSTLSPSLDGHWEIISEALPNIWLRSFTIVGDFVLYDDMTIGWLEHSSCSLVLAGRELSLVRGMLRRMDESGMTVFYRRWIEI